MKNKRSFIMDQNQIISSLKKDWEKSNSALRKHERMELIKKGTVLTSKAILGLTLIAGTLTIASVAPNFFGLIGKIIKDLQKDKYINKKELKRNINYLKSKGYVRAHKLLDGYSLELTDKGKEMALFDAEKKFKLENVHKKDNKLRVVIFDIPRKLNVSRNAIREKLRSIGMQQLQDSVFVSEFPCENELFNFAEMYKIIPFIKIIEATKIKDFL